MKKSIIILLGLIVSCFIMTGCEMTGKVKKVVINQQDMGNYSPILRMIQLQNIRIEQDGTRLIAIGAYPWGEYTEDDRLTLESSIKESINNLQLARNQKTPNMKIYIIIRRHLVAFSNNNGAALACVAWCATIGNELIYSEQFYAAAGGRLRAVGSIKDEIHRSIIKRVLFSAVILANDGFSSNKLPLNVDGTHAKFIDAITPLPASLTGTPPPGYIYVRGNPSAQVPWSWAEPTEGVYWQKYIR